MDQGTHHAGRLILQIGALRRNPEESAYRGLLAAARFAAIRPIAQNPIAFQPASK
jgi:hypothetical protein